MRTWPPSLVGTRRRFVAGAAGLVIAPRIAQAQESAGVALVIGNSKYRWEAPLQNVARDAPDVAKRFRELGLKTELVQDVGREAMFAAIDRFKAAAAGASLAAFYFAGHGAFWQRETYLVPVDSDLADTSTVQRLLPVSAVAAATKGAAHRLLVFDNCRNNPADGWRQRWALEQSAVTAVNLTATMLRGPNTLLLYSTAPGRAALDGPAGDNSPFAATFLEELDKPSVDLKTLVPGLRRGLLLRTNGRQIIWDESTFAASHVLTRRQGSAGPTSVPTARVMELPKAYAFAHEKKLSLPDGLAAIRSPTGSANDARLGSYATTIKIKFGTANVPAVSIEPLILIVLAIDDGGLAQTIVSSRLHNMEQAGSAWGLVQGQLTGSEIEFKAHASMKLRWKDPNSGLLDVGDGWLTVPSVDSFRRLD